MREAASLSPNAPFCSLTSKAVFGEINLNGRVVNCICKFHTLMHIFIFSFLEISKSRDNLGMNDRK